MTTMKNNPNQKTQMKLKLRVDSANSKHVHMTVFSRDSFDSGDTLANCGSLCMSPGEYQLFAVALSLGSERMGESHLTVEHDDAVFRDYIKNLPEDKK